MTFYPDKIALGDITGDIIDQLEPSERLGILIRRAAAEVAYATRLFAPDDHRVSPTEWPGTEADRAALADMLLNAALLSFDGPAPRNGTLEELAMREVGRGLAAGWRLATQARRHRRLP